ncbi:unnamed protein product [Cladocopium goreaui]|uniref:RanBP2-type domain-containing protein n=1 Tax=Cladocopium goreaui TaxID=2562237 RepID=A0A9P1GNA1_9DINO|nr:unnamed protein product [Cladocopium goreaui]
MRGRNDDEGCETCVGAGQLEGFFNNSSLESERRGWGHLVSTYFQGTLFFHLQRSPALRGVEWARDDVVFFEVMEINGRYEAVKMLLPSMMETQLGSECKAEADIEQFEGQRIQGNLRSQWQLVKEKKWGFVSCNDLFAGNVFWHLDENPKMKDVKFQRGDVVEFEVYRDDSRGEKSQSRARNMEFIHAAETQKGEQKLREFSKYLSPSKLLKKQKWIDNWRAGPPPDWTCKGCGYHNFGRNKICKTCDTKRPPREEWPEEKDEELQKAVAPNIPLLPAAFQANLPVQFQSFAQKPLEVRRNFVEEHASKSDKETDMLLDATALGIGGLETDMMLDATALGTTGLQTDTFLDATALGTTGLQTDMMLDATALGTTGLQTDTFLDATALGTTGLQTDTFLDATTGLQTDTFLDATALGIGGLETDMMLDATALGIGGLETDMMLDATALGIGGLETDMMLDATALGTTGLQTDTFLDATALGTTGLQTDTFLDATALGTTGLQTDTFLDATALGTTGWQTGATPDATDWHRDTASGWNTDAAGWKTDGSGWNRNTTQNASGWQADEWHRDTTHASGWERNSTPDASGWRSDANQHASAWQTGANATGWQDAKGWQTNTMVDYLC